MTLPLGRLWLPVTLAMLLALACAANLALADPDNIPYPPTPESTLDRGLPQKLQAIVPGKTTRHELYRLLGRPKRKQPSQLFYSLVGSDEDTTVWIDQRDLVSRVVFKPLERSPLAFANFARWSGSKAPGQPLQFPTWGYELEFRGQSPFDLVRVTLLPPEGRASGQ